MIYYNYLGQAMAVSADPTTFVSGDSAGNETITAPVGPSGVSVNGGNYDTLIGSEGDNTFYVNNTTDVVQVASGLSGVKSIVSYAGGYTLPDNVQNLTFYGAGNWGAGNSQANLIIMGGNDQNYMDGGAGNDVLVGGFGKNAFGVEAGNGNDVIYNFHTNQDTVRMPGTGFTSFAQVEAAMTQVGSDVVLQLDPTETLTFRGTTVSSFQASDFLLPLDRSLLGSLTFDDEFNSLNLFDFSTGQGLWRDNFGGDPTKADNYTITSNAEKEVYTDASFQGTSDHALGLNPFSIDNGVLTITASAIGPDSQYAFGQPYSSGMLNTKGIFMQQYGYFEMKAELPTGLGTWPAFWLSQDPYAPGTEADVLEALGLYPGVDFARADDAGSVTSSTYYSQSNLTGFHTYGLLWTPTVTAFYVDGTAVMEMATPASWDKPMYLIVDLAMGGWGGPVDEASLPAQMNIDYVRVYGLADGSQVVQQETPAGPAGTLTADGAALALVNSAGWTGATMLADGHIVLVSSVDGGYGSHKADAMIYDPGTGAQVGDTVQLFGYANANQTMDPQVTALAGSFWQVSYAGTNAPQGFEIYNSQGVGAFFDNQYTVGTPVFTPLVSGGHVVTNGAWTQFAVVGGDGSTNWYNDPILAGQPATATEVHALSNGGFYFTYAGQQQIDVFDPTGATDMQGHLGAPVSSFAMASDALPNGQFAVAWLAPGPNGSFNDALTFQTFDAAGHALTAATTVATDADPWHTEMKVISTGPGDALMLWSQGGAINGAYAHGSTIDAATPLIVGALDNTTQTALSDGHILLTWLQTDSGVQDLWSEILNPSTMTGARQQLGQADGGMSVVALDNGAYAVSWHSGSQIMARGYDGEGHYGPTTTVAGDFVARDASGDVVSIYQGPGGTAMLQHYAMTDYFSV
jgi:beta-glucanase (GH16 family)